jgi:hypothetical protein
MAYANGRLPRSALGEITRAANGDRAYLRKDVARLFLAMNAESVRRYGVTLRATSGRVAYRTYAEQQYFWNLYLSGNGNLAARPGTSNHGLGTTIDFATPQMRAIVDKIGAKYGFAKRWSDAPSEWWHIKCVPSKATYKPFKVLKYRSQGSRVKWIQRRLRARGFKSVKVNGFFGEATVSAVKRFQKAKKMSPNGIVGPTTWEKLR